MLCAGPFLLPATFEMSQRSRRDPSTEVGSSGSCRDPASVRSLGRGPGPEGAASPRGHRAWVRRTSPGLESGAHAVCGRAGGGLHNRFPVQCKRDRPPLPGAVLAPWEEEPGRPARRNGPDPIWGLGPSGARPDRPAPAARAASGRRRVSRGLSIFCLVQPCATRRNAEAVGLPAGRSPGADPGRGTRRPRGRGRASGPGAGR